MLTILKNKLSFSKMFISVFYASLFFVVLPAAAKAAEVKEAEVKGFAWSDTIGWIQFDTGKSNPVTYDRTTGQLSGYAWSNNIGWIKFDGLSASEGVGGSDAKADISTGAISGWARACAGTQSAKDKCDNMVSRTDGWDGWVKFDTGKNNPVKIDFTTGDFSGYAWGSEVVGWISFNCSNTNGCGTSNYKVTIGPAGRYNLSATIITPDCGTGTVVSDPLGIDCPDGFCFNYFTQGDKVILTAAPTDGSTFSGWGGDASSCETSSTCVVIMTADKNVTADFDKTDCSEEPLTVTCSADSDSVTVDEDVTFTAKRKEARLLTLTLGSATRIFRAMRKRLPNHIQTREQKMPT